jgi:hypothetical protein
MKNLPKHPLERTKKCPVCSVEYQSIPVRRGRSPDDHSLVLEQHVCPNGHVYVTEIGKDEMLNDW